MKRRLLNLLTALSLLTFAFGTFSCVRSNRLPQSRITQAEAASRPASAPMTTANGTPAWAEALVGAIRNDQLLWEIEWPTPDTYKDLVAGPHFSPRGRPGSPVAVLAPWEPWVSGFPQPGRPPLAIEVVAEPLLRALHDPDRWMAAHMILTHLLLRGEAKTETQLFRQWLRDYNLKEYWGWPKEDFAPNGDGSYRYWFNGVRADLKPQGPERPFDYGGSYGGKFIVRAAAARIDRKQMAETRQWWAEVLKPVLEETEQTNAPADEAEPEEE